jgi:NAD-dependent deacetylase
MHIVILTGAGISAESGLATFRDSDGLWSGYSIEEVATPQGYKKNPQLVLDFYNNCRREVALAQPNAAHHALAKLQQSDHKVTIITQNVDDLHERAGSEVLHMHGSLADAICTSCGFIQPATDHMAIHNLCPSCRNASVRPNIVWFGEEPHHMLDIDHELRRCDLFIAIGTSGNVYPAAGFVQLAGRKAHTIEFNLNKSEVSSDFREHVIGPAGTTVPHWVDRFLERRNTSNV